MLWGLGSADMKGGLAVMLALAEAVAEPAVDVTYVFYAGEEVAAEHNGLAHLVRDRPDLLAGDVAILGEPTGGELEAGCQGTLRIEVTLRGQRAHTARPWMGRNAIHRLGALLRLVDGFEERRPVIQGCEYREALQAVVVSGGVAGNVVPDVATVTLNRRFAPDRTEAEAADEVRALLAPVLEDGDEVTVVDSAPAAAPGLDNPILRGAHRSAPPRGHRQARLDRRRPLRRARRARLQPRPRRRHPRPHRRRAGRPRLARARLRGPPRRPHDTALSCPPAAGPALRLGEGYASVAVRVMVVPVSAWLTGQPVLAASAAATKSSADMPGTVPRTVRWMPVIPSPGWKVTSAVVSSVSGGRARLGEPVGQRHREAGRVGGADQLLGARATGGLLGTRRPGDVEAAQTRRLELDAAGALEEGAVPGGGGGTGGGHRRPRLVGGG